MSLINKMLQDLEQRRVDVTLGAAMHDHVRAVASEPKRIHTAWWLVLLLAVSLLAMLAWLWLDRKSTRLNSSHIQKSRMPSSA